MKTDIFQNLGRELRHLRTSKQLTQPELASRTGRSSARISELERDLINGRLGRDRLTLLADICDALDVEPVLVPRTRTREIRRLLDQTLTSDPGRTRTTFDEVFVDLSGFEDDD